MDTDRRALLNKTAIVLAILAAAWSIFGLVFYAWPILEAAIKNWL